MWPSQCPKPVPVPFTGHFFSMRSLQLPARAIKPWASATLEQKEDVLRVL